MIESWRDVLVIAVIAGLLAVGLLLRIGPDIGGTVVAGEVIDKHEAIEMPLHDTWRHAYNVAYRFRPAGATLPSMGRHPVDAALFDRLRVGSRVNVRYRRLPILGAVFGPESALADASWWSRMPSASESARELVELAAVAFACIAGIVAYRRSSRWLGLVAAAIGVTVASTVLMLGFFLFPCLFWAWRSKPGAGFGWVLLCSMTLTPAALYYRTPHPAPAADREARGTAVVRRVEIVDRIWASSSSSGESEGGESIWRPFQMVDLELVAPGRTEAVHAIDRVDLNSVAGLAAGAVVPVTYPVGDPRAARIAGGTRRYGVYAWVYFLALTYGIGAALALIVFPVRYLARRLASSHPVLRFVFDPAERARLLAAFPIDKLRDKR